MKPKFNVFAAAATAHVDTIPPPPFDVRVADLPAGYGLAVRRAVAEGINSCTWHGQLYVSLADLQELAGPGSDTDDPDGGCYVPPTALADPDAVDPDILEFQARHPWLEL